MSTYAVSSSTNGIAVSTGSVNELVARGANGSISTAAVVAAVVAVTEDDLDRMEAVAPASGVAKPNQEPARVVKLTKREVEVLTLVIEGNSSKEVADHLYVSKRTVDFHLANIYHKLGVTNRVQAFREATRRGLIPFSIVGAARQ